MRLHLVNDLPLFREDPDGALEDLVVGVVRTIAAGLPARLSYVGYQDLARLWSRTVAWPADALVLVGTRPPLLTRDVDRTVPAAVVPMMTRRRLDPGGRTSEVDLVAGAGRLDPAARTVVVADDVLMSATTVLAVLAEVRRQVGPGVAVQVRAALATPYAARRIEAAHPAVTVVAAAVLDYEPIVGGTAIFLSDLLFGTLRGAPFLEQAELLRPFLGADLTALCALRDAVALSHPPRLETRIR
ncbi:hypothetical protein [Longispora urticae]